MVLEVFLENYGVDMCNILLSSFFVQGCILLEMNSNVVSLVPKIYEAISIKDFRPIVVAKFSFKIISKILTDRLGTIASQIISANQSGFVQGKHI